MEYLRRSPTHANNAFAAAGGSPIGGAQVDNNTRLENDSAGQRISTDADPPKKKPLGGATHCFAKTNNWTPATGQQTLRPNEGVSTVISRLRRTVTTARPGGTPSATEVQSSQRPTTSNTKYIKTTSNQHDSPDIDHRQNRASRSTFYDEVQPPGLNRSNEHLDRPAQRVPTLDSSCNIISERHPNATSVTELAHYSPKQRVHNGQLGELSTGLLITRTSTPAFTAPEHPHQDSPPHQSRIPATRNRG